jgi:hypothetical protein
MIGTAGVAIKPNSRNRNAPVSAAINPFTISKNIRLEELIVVVLRRNDEIGCVRIDPTPKPMN